MKAPKRRANAVLAAAAGLFIIALTLKYIYPGSWLAAAFLTVTEASLAGGVADWFAVTALFRRPLGFPYHTALIPRNRKRVIEGLANAVEKDFLSKQSIKARLNQVTLLDKLIAYAQTTPVRPAIRAVIDKVIDELAETIDPKVVGRFGERVLKLVLRRQSAAPHAAAGIAWLLQQGKDGQLYNALIDELTAVVHQAKTREMIFAYLEQLKEKTAKKSWLSGFVTGFMEGIDGINLTDAADALHQELVRTVDDLKEEQHPVRLWFQDELKTLAVKLETPEWEEVVNNWRDGLLARFDFAEPLSALAHTVLTALKQPTAYREYATEWITDQIEFYWQQFQKNAALQGQVEDYLKTLLIRIIDQEHQLIGEVANSALNKLSDEDLNQFIEDKAGEDLDWIRINGVIVGGLAGVGLVVIRLLFQ